MAQAQINRSGPQPLVFTGSQRQSFDGQPQPQRHPSYAGSVASYGYPSGYPGAPPQRGSMQQHGRQVSGQYTTASQMGGRSQSRNSLARQSRSLGASKASLASQRSGKSCIQQEYHDKKIRQNMQSPFYGRGRTPFTISIVLFVLGGLLIVAGVVVLLLRFHNNIMLTIDKGEIIGPLLVALGVGAIAGGIKFYYDAYKVSNSERRQIKFTAASESLITAKPTSSSSKGYRPPPGEALMSGTASANAVSRTPHGSMASLSHV